jgi:hypothetical protein
MRVQPWGNLVAYPLLEFRTRVRKLSLRRGGSRLELLKFGCKRFAIFARQLAFAQWTLGIVVSVARGRKKPGGEGLKPELGIFALGACPKRWLPAVSS